MPLASIDAVVVPTYVVATMSLPHRRTVVSRWNGRTNSAYAGVGFRVRWIVSI
nr:MAG TPA: hypothetical protein [Caudoviricetes sp.]